MRIVISVLAILFGLLHIIAARTQLKSEDAAARGLSIAMVCGGVCVAVEAAAHLLRSNPGWMDALSVAAGCLLICVPAYENGRRAGNVHISHHIIRGGIAVLLVVGFILW